MALYPPILDSSYPAFVPSASEVFSLQFELSNLTNLNEIGNVQIRLVKQSSNISIVKTNKYPDGIIVKMRNAIIPVENKLNTYVVNIISSDIENWQLGTYYKVQIRFNSYDGTYPSNIAEFATWKKNSQSGGYKTSEWSTVMILKPITRPILTILNNSLAVETSQGNEGYLTETSTTPLFQGKFTSLEEYEQSYKFDLYKYEDQTEIFIESSDWKTHVNLLEQNADSYRFKTVLQNGHYYTVKYSIITQNNYTDTTSYTFHVNESLQNPDDIIYLFLTISQVKNNINIILNNYGIENACINILLCGYGQNTTEEGIIEESGLAGNYIISRSSEKTNYTVWEDLFIFIPPDSSDKEKYKIPNLVYQDFFIESGIRYKYRIQKQFSTGMRTVPVLATLYETTYSEDLLDKPYVIEKNGYPMSIDFEYAYLYENGVQLKLMYDNTMNSFKHTVLVTKQDTLGSKFPTIYRNGYAYYAEFPVNGLISLNMDEDETFFHKIDNIGYYYKDELVIPFDKYEERDYERNTNCALTPIGFTSTFDTNLTHNNIFMERKFREKVEEFLNNGSYKIFKSPTEGNFIITLMNVQLSPKEELGRMIYSFSATAYEVMDFTLENLNNFGIMDMGTYSEVLGETAYFMGQIAGYYDGIYYYEVSDDGTTRVRKETTPTNLFNEIIKDNEFAIASGGTASYQFNKLEAFWIESYPNINLQSSIIALENELIILDNKRAALDEIISEDERAELEFQINKDEEEATNKLNNLLKIQNQLQYQEDYPVVRFTLNDKEFMTGHNKMYVLNNTEFTSEAETELYLTYSGLVVLNYICSVVPIENKEAIVNSITTVNTWDQLQGIFTEKRNFNDVLENYVYPIKDDTKIQSEQFNMNLYSSLDIMEIIKEKTKLLIEEQHSNGKPFIYTNKDGIIGYSNGSLWYSFDNLLKVEIEADKFTHLIVNDKEVIIGPTEKYILEATYDNPISSLKFTKPTYAIINFYTTALLIQRGSGSQNESQSLKR